MPPINPMSPMNPMTLPPQIPPLRAHLNDLVTREQYPLVGAAEFMAATLETAAVVTRDRFPELPSGTEQFRATVFQVHSLLVQVMSGMEPDEDEPAPAPAPGSGPHPAAPRR